jgi:lactate dehydrogenase-like 2-hydroxyacid dehydrogenase
MPVILLTNKYSDKVLAVVRNELPEGFEFISLQNTGKEELIQKATRADYFLASGRVPIDKEVIESAVKLKMIQRTGVGTDTIDLKTLKERGIPVYVNSGINSTSVAEHTVMLMLSVLRRLSMVDTEVKTGKWGKNDLGIECHSLNGKTVGIIGIGNIGKKVVKLLQPFGVTIGYYSRSRLTENEEKELNIHYYNLVDLFKKVDILSLHCPLTLQTKGFIGASEIASMRQGAIVINTARGQLIEETALIEALKSGHIRGAGLDVFSQEPPNKDNPLFNFNNVILTPHVGGLTLETFKKMMQDAFENIKMFDDGRFDLIENKKLQ